MNVRYTPTPTEKEKLYSIGRNVQKLRIKSGYDSALQFCDINNINYNNYKKIEQGFHNPKIITLHRIAQIHNVDVKELL